jgi:hypothetical protein
VQEKEGEKLPVMAPSTIAGAPIMPAGSFAPSALPGTMAPPLERDEIKNIKVQAEVLVRFEIQ